MALWGLIVAGCLAAGSLPLLIGWPSCCPVLGHASWHLYRASSPTDWLSSSRQRVFAMLSSIATADSPWYVDIGRIAFAALLGALIGWERERRGREAGIRTYMATALGACAFGLISAAIGD